jgi:hypothetical protein
LTVAGQEITRFNLINSWNEYTVNTRVLGGVNVEFLNDASGRDVELDWVTINGLPRESENQTYNTATYANGRCGGGQGNVMHCSGIIGFGDIVNDNERDTEISYGHISHLPMPVLVTIAAEYDVSANGYCAKLIAYNTTSGNQPIRFNFEVPNGSITSSWNYRGNATSGVITGTPNSNMVQTLAANQRSDFATFGYCVQK